MRILACILGLGAAGWAAPASAQTALWKNFSFAEMRSVLQHEKATVTNETVDDAGLRYLTARAEGGLIFQVYGTECDSKEPGQRCKGADFIASFTLKDGVDPLKVADEIDYSALSDYRLGANRVAISRYVILDDGISEANLWANAAVFLNLADAVWDALSDKGYLKD